MNDTPPTTSKEAIAAPLDWLDEPDLVPPMEGTTESKLAHLRTLGFAVFPCQPNKTPRAGFKWQDKETIGGWKFGPGELIGVRLTGNQMVLDIDKPDVFAASGRETPPSAETSTLTAGHRHVF